MNIYIDFLLKINSKFDLFITVPSDEILNELNDLFSNNNVKSEKLEIIKIANIGRDLFPWLALTGKLEEYDFVGHFHTKKSPHKYNLKGESWLLDNLNSLIGNFKNIQSSFYCDDKLGIVIPDVPYYFQFISSYNVFNKSNKEKCNELWNKMSLKNKMKKLDFNDIVTPIMSYGTMFWYRPKALKPLFDLQLTKDDFPSEPIPIDGTIAHAIERLPVYIAWSEGYDFKIATNNNRVITGFEYKEYTTINNIRKQNEIKRLKKSFTLKKALIRSIKKTWLWKK